MMWASGMNKDVIPSASRASHGILLIVPSLSLDSGLPCQPERGRDPPTGSLTNPGASGSPPNCCRIEASSALARSA